MSALRSIKGNDVQEQFMIQENPSNNWEWRYTWRTFSYRRPLKHGYQPMLSYSCIWMNIEKMHTIKTDCGNKLLWSKSALHRMNMGDEHHWWCQHISFYNMIKRAERNPLRRTLSIQQRAFYCKLWDACLDDLAVPWRLMISYTWRVCFNWRQVCGWLAI